MNIANEPFVYDDTTITSIFDEVNLCKRFVRKRKEHSKKKLIYLPSWITINVWYKDIFTFCDSITRMNGAIDMKGKSEEGKVSTNLKFYVTIA